MQTSDESKQSDISTLSIPEQLYAAGISPDSCLAQISRISGVDNIPGADLVQCYTLAGWKCVARKNEFKEGDLAVYIKIGSILDPTVSHFSFLEGKPLKTKKIRGVVSQGLIGPLSWLSSGTDNQEFKENDDVTTILKIRKYQEKEELTSLGSGSVQRPSFIPKTDADRVQNLSANDWNALIGKTAYVTRKEDGTSTTYFYNEEKFGITSRNCLIDMTDTGRSVFHYLEMARQFQIREKMQHLKRNIAIQGEIVGPGINGNRLKLTALDFRVFGVWDITEGKYLPPTEVDSLCKELKLNQVPHIVTVQLSAKEANAAYWLSLADTLQYGFNIRAEGLVLRTYDGNIEMRFKAISNSYLLKHNL